LRTPPSTMAPARELAIARTIAGKIVVYPQLGDFPLMELDELVAKFPSIGPTLLNGCWTKASEEELLRVAGGAL